MADPESWQETMSQDPSATSRTKVKVKPHVLSLVGRVQWWHAESSF